MPERGRFSGVLTRCSRSACEALTLAAQTLDEAVGGRLIARRVLGLAHLIDAMSVPEEQALPVDECMPATKLGGLAARLRAQTGWPLLGRGVGAVGTSRSVSARKGPTSPASTLRRSA